MFYYQTELYVLTRHINQLKRNLGTSVVAVVIPYQSSRESSVAGGLCYTEGGLWVATRAPSPPLGALRTLTPTRTISLAASLFILPVGWALRLCQGNPVRTPEVSVANLRCCVAPPRRWLWRLLSAGTI